jgi:hypothetical protein
MKRILFLIAVAIAVLASCDMGKIDNFDQPNGAIYGTVTDELTKGAFQSEQPNGYQIILNEKGGTIPIRFWGKPDGTFENAWIFQNDYEVSIEGAFFPVQPVNVTVGSRTEVNFQVTPFLAITDVSVQSLSGKITASYKIARSRVGDKIMERKTVVSDVPTANNAVFVAKSETNVSNLSDEEILTASFTDEISGLEKGTYYVRIAARTANATGRYNYSKIIEIEMP